MQLRFDYLFQVEYRIDETLLQYKIIKFSPAALYRKCNYPRLYGFSAGKAPCPFQSSGIMTAEYKFRLV